MVDQAQWLRIQEELERGEAARAAGNEGRARVCARRAAGLAVGAYLKANGYPASTSSAYDRLRYLCTVPGISPDWQTAAEQLLARVTPEHTLPYDVDLIAVSCWLIAQLLGKTPEK